MSMMNASVTTSAVSKVCCMCIGLILSSPDDIRSCDDSKLWR